MREKLNENRTAQIALVALLVIGAAYLLLGGSGGSSPSATAGAEEGAAAGAEAVPASATSAVSAPADRPLPEALDHAYREGKTIALLIYRPGGIDDRKVTAASSVLADMPNVAFFSAPERKIAAYAAITGPLGVNAAPALIVVRPRGLNGKGAAPATVTYGFQSASAIEQAVRDAGYHGPHLTYAPN